VNINYFWTLWSKINFYYFDWGATLSQEEYERLHEAGVYSVLVYQETYHRMCIKVSY
jgi:2-iminoacetate synthase